MGDRTQTNISGIRSENDVVNHSTTKDPLKKEKLRLGKLKYKQLHV
jgi:hypothetical protein